MSIFPDEPEQTTEKLWVAAVETFAIGGACQILHTVDHVIATRGTRLYLPARKEGILPGASNLRLARSVGDRLARQAILSGLEFEAGKRLAADGPQVARALGLEPDWYIRAVEAGGNYGEIFERNVGAKSPLGLERGLNRLWRDGGLMYSPPFR